jgi:hypothetical protein
VPEGRDDRVTKASQAGVSKISAGSPRRTGRRGRPVVAADPADRRVKPVRNRRVFPGQISGTAPCRREGIETNATTADIIERLRGPVRT